MGYRYDWQDLSSPIKQINVTRNAGGWLQVVIFAPETFSEKLTELPQYLTRQGFVTYGDTVNGQQVYKVADFGKKEAPVLDALRSGGFITGTSSRVDAPDHIKELTGLAKVRRYSANLSSIFGIAGHVLQIAYGRLTGDKDRITAGLLYGTSNMLGAAFGSGAGPIQFSRITSGLHDFLHKEGLRFIEPSIKTPEIIYRDRLLGRRIWDLAKSHPIQVLNAIALPGNLALLRSGIKEASTHKGMPLRKRPGASTALAATVAATSALIAILIPEVSEMKIEEFKKKKGFLKLLHDGEIGNAIKILPDSIYMFIARKPLAVQGALLLTDNASMLKDAYETSKNFKQNSGMHPLEPTLKWGIGGLYTTASAFTAITSEKRNKYYESPQAYEGLYTQVANLLLTSPEGTRPEIIRQAAAYLAADRDVHIDEYQIEQGLTAKIAELKQNPWLQSALSLAQSPLSPPAQPGFASWPHSTDVARQPSGKYVEKVGSPVSFPKPLPAATLESWTQRCNDETTNKSALAGNQTIRYP